MANPKSSKAAYGAESGGNTLNFKPENLVLVEAKDHPLYDERIHLPLDEATVRNIMHFGVKVPILVKKDTETGQVMVVDGRQRVRHAIEANKRLAEQGRPLLEVPAIVVRGSNEDAFDLTIITNEIRQNDTPLVRAGKMAKMLQHGRNEPKLWAAEQFLVSLRWQAMRGNKKRNGTAEVGAGLDMGQCVIDKFNQTSRKVGSDVFLGHGSDNKSNRVYADD